MTTTPKSADRHTSGRVCQVPSCVSPSPNPKEEVDAFRGKGITSVEKDAANGRKISAGVLEVHFQSPGFRVR